MTEPRRPLAILIALALSACASRFTSVEGPPPPRAEDVERIEVRGEWFRDSGPEVITNRQLITSIVDHRVLAAGSWRVHEGPLPADPRYLIEIWGARGLLATYKSSPDLCLWFACPGWVGLERPGETSLVRSVSEGWYLMFITTLLEGDWVKRRARLAAAKVLGRDEAQIDVAQPLVEQGADDLDIVEIVMEVEDDLGLEIPDSAIADDQGSVKAVSVQRLADAVVTLRASR